MINDGSVWMSTRFIEQFGGGGEQMFISKIFAKLGILMILHLMWL